MDSLLPPDVAALAARVIAENRAAGRRIALAESCTGGLVAAALTDVAGSSAVFDRGFVTYSNEAKQDLLGVSDDLIDTFGAVSPAVAWAMAQGALAQSLADVAVAITGIAGPEGGTAQKPIGTVAFARACCGDQPDQVYTDLRLFALKTRAEVRHAATICALELLLPEPSRSDVQPATAAP